MDGLRFDALARHLCVLTGRRAGLRLLLAGVAAGGLGLASVFGVGVDEAPAKKHRKKKKRKKAARCKSVASRCRENAESCSRGCVQTGLCACSGTGNRCNRHSDCCSGNDVCSISACENVNVPICCGLEGSVCLDRCDCCIGFPCIDGTCGGPPRCCPAGACCPFSGKRSGSGEANGECSNGDDCQCCDGQICAEVTCNGGEVFRCCRESGSCVDDCDCCGINRCVNGSCQASACLPDEEVCPAGHFEPCCPPGSTCTQPGCVTDAPRACPAGADSCARPLVFCGGGSPRRPLDCACFLDLAGNPFCSIGRGPCDSDCTSDAECETEPRFAGSRCIRCVECGHAPGTGVCASPCPDAA